MSTQYKATKELLARSRVLDLAFHKTQSAEHNRPNIRLSPYVVCRTYVIIVFWHCDAPCYLKLRTNCDKILGRVDAVLYGRCVVLRYL